MRHHHRRRTLPSKARLTPTDGDRRARDDPSVQEKGHVAYRSTRAVTAGQALHLENQCTLREARISRRMTIPPPG